MRACSSSRASCHPLMVTDPTLSVVFLATIFLLPSSLYRKGTAQINLSDAVETVQPVEKVVPTRSVVPKQVQTPLKQVQITYKRGPRPLRGSVNRRVAYVSRHGGKAIESL